ncbi:MAG: hypothetical protein ACRDA3_13115 [Peptostreptococcaceae bacterium]
MRDKKANLDEVVRFRSEDDTVEIFTVSSKKEIQVVEKNKLTPKQKTLLKNKSDLNRYGENLGGYVHMSYVKNELLFNRLDIDRANISRLIYLSSYIDYNDRSENLLIKHSKDYKVEPLTRADLKIKLGLSDTAFKSFMSDMKKSNLLFEVDKKFYISSDYFNKGDIKDSQFKSKEYTRLFINTTRMLYENSKPRQHKQLSYIYQLVPFMNYELNILCSNPNETDFYELDKLSLVRICELLGVSIKSDAMRKLRDEILKFYIVINNKKYFILSYVKIRNGYGIKDYFLINPQIVWGGTDTEVVKDTIQACFFS